MTKEKIQKTSYNTDIFIFSHCISFSLFTLIQWKIIKFQSQCQANFE